MRTLFLRLFLLAALGLALPARAQLEWRVSVKFILDTNGALPNNAIAGYGNASVQLTNANAVSANIDYANRLLDRLGRGYRFRLVEVVNLSGVGEWFSVNARDNRSALESAVNGNPARFAYRSGDINVYINNSSSGQCSFPGGGNVIFAGAEAYDTLLIHEMGHYFNLLHTHEGESGSCASGSAIGGNSDGCPDTLPDHECFSRDQLSRANFGNRAYAALNPDEQIRCDMTYSNIMSYHLSQHIYTSDQLDRATDVSNGPRLNVATGRTRFVDRANVSNSPDGSSQNKTSSGTSGGPYKTLGAGVAAANPGDIVLVRANNYGGALTISKTCTLRATRGTAHVGQN